MQAEPEMKKEVGGPRALAHKRTRQNESTRRGDRKTSEVKRRIGQDERQPVMARLPLGEGVPTW